MRFLQSRRSAKCHYIQNGTVALSVRKMALSRGTMNGTTVLTGSCRAVYVAPLFGTFSGTNKEILELKNGTLWHSRPYKGLWRHFANALTRLVGLSSATFEKYFLDKTSENRGF